MGFFEGIGDGFGVAQVGRVLPATPGDNVKLPSELLALASEVVADAPATSWYLIVSTSTAVATRVVDIEDGAELVIGRIARCDIAIDHDSVSRRHAVLRRSGENVTVADLESRNGTFYLDQRVKEIVLSPGSRIRAGKTVIAFELDTDATEEQLDTLLKLTERYCVVFQTLAKPSALSLTVKAG